MLLGAALVASGASVSSFAQDLTSQVSTTETVAPSSDIAVVPSAGLNGQNGGSGYYTCPQMTWGEACASVGYSFPTAIVHAPGNGGAAPTSGTVTNLTSSNTGVAQIENYDAGSSSYSVLSSPSTIVVTQEGYNSETSVLTSVSAMTSTAWVNDGAAFTISGQIDNGVNPATPFSVAFGETLNGSNVPTDGRTLAEVATEFNTQSTTNSWGLTASVISSGSDYYLEIIASTEGDDREITISTTGAVTASGLGVGNGAPLSDLDFGGAVATSGTEIQTYPWLYTLDGVPQSSDNSRITVDGVELNLVALGTTVIDGSVANGTVPTGLAGNPGNVGNDITIADSWDTVNVAGTAYLLSTTGGVAGQAGVGGAGGRGGAGAN
ncbi:MAG: hypothetical protein KDJ88_16885, partial [Bauldia sp.]|nr:hypothetical protein [Bauldia sp.]